MTRAETSLKIILANLKTKGELLSHRFQLTKWLQTFFVLASITLSTSVSTAQTDELQKRDCDTTIFEKIEYDYCIYKTDRSKNPDILFYFHGLLGSEKDWSLMPDHRQMRNIWKQNNQTAPTVITISFGRKWLLSEVPTSPLLFEKFTKQILPALEEKAGGLAPGRRLLLGKSMGGFNSSQVLFKTNLFEKVALACPALPTIGPLSTKQEIKDYIERNNASKLRVYSVIEWTQSEFKTQAEWEAHSPLHLAAQHLSPNSPQIMLSCGDQDEYGFFEGANAFADLAQKKGAPVTWLPVVGEHCEYDLEKFAQFLIE